MRNRGSEEHLQDKRLKSGIDITVKVSDLCLLIYKANTGIFFEEDNDEKQMLDNTFYICRLVFQKDFPLAIYPIAYWRNDREFEVIGNRDKEVNEILFLGLKDLGAYFLSGKTAAWKKEIKTIVGE